jgi:hypothetical protein
MKSFKQLLRSWLLDEANYRSEKLVNSTSVTAVEDDAGLNIHVRPAIGGRVVSFRHYDRKTDRNYSKVYVVPEDQDFERELSRMITLESLR